MGRIFRIIVVCILTAFGWMSPGVASESPVYWPTEDWQISTPEEQGMASDTLADMLQKIGQLDYGIDNVTIVRNGYIVTDVYYFPFKKDLKHIIHSCTKSIISSLIGIAIGKGYIQNVNQLVLDFFPEKTPEHLDANKKSITLEHLLTMSTGLSCRDSYLYKWSGMNEMRASRDWIQYVLDLPMSEAPGSRFEYCNGASYLLSAILQKTIGEDALSFAREFLFDPLGISDVEWPYSPQFINIGWGEMWLKPHDMAKFGYLYLNGGRWGDKQIVPAEWVEASTCQQIEARTMAEGYGYQWWIALDDYYTALGYGGQFIMVVPRLNMVVVFTGALAGRNFYTPVQLLYDYIFPSVLSSEALPVNPSGVARLDSLTKTYANPLPEPVPVLPKMAQAVSGKTIVFDANDLRFNSASLTFRKGADEAGFEMSDAYRHIEATIGLDNVFRFTQFGGYSRAYKGAWENDSTFFISHHIVGHTQRGSARLIFKEKNIEVSIYNLVSNQKFDLVGRFQD